MKASAIFPGVIAGAVIALIACAARCADVVSTVSPTDISVRNEVQHAIDQGLAWLATHQSTNGSWSAPEHPAVTALALSAFMGDPSGGGRGKPHCL